MLRGLHRRARRAGLADRITASLCTPDHLGVAQYRGAADLALAIHMVHEVADRRRLLAQLHEVLRPGGSLVILEPRGHVSPQAFERTLALADAVGFERTKRPVEGGGPGAVLVKRA